ncbi:hypothetical protein GC101_17165 [Paenibacillus sp. LMG 31459]|uniref:Uncharacterized protein n=1 Tax=Paenibacillus phytohabitans TaxID=2654978 RepID=A0ABX1YKX8_9BACL|nr:hypothetical protein [Paenibacillus phytohabitans]NOU80596.1 hypothetical protein [Paenibacillus phytohabitans]
MEIIKRIIENRTAKIFDGFFENESGGRFEDFMRKIQSIPAISSENIINLEEIFLNHTREVLDISYELGFVEGRQLNKNGNVDIIILNNTHMSGSEEKNLA